MPDQITVELRLLNDAKPVVAIASVSLETAHGELTISKVKVIHQDGKQPWVALPELHYKDNQSGEWKNVPFLTPSARLKKAISEAVLAEYQRLGVESH